MIAAIAACKNDLQRGEDNLVRMKAALRSLQRERRAVETEESTPIGQNKRGAKANRPVSDAKVILSFAREELRRVGHPLNRAEIAERLANSGIAIGAKAPLDRVAKVMWLAKEFQNVGDGYWFAGEPVPPNK